MGRRLLRNKPWAKGTSAQNMTKTKLQRTGDLSMEGMKMNRCLWKKWWRRHIFLSPSPPSPSHSHKKSRLGCFQDGSFQSSGTSGGLQILSSSQVPCSVSQLTHDYKMPAAPSILPPRWNNIRCKDWGWLPLFHTSFLRTRALFPEAL